VPYIAIDLLVIGLIMVWPDIALALTRYVR
jgi:TRAP-type mannitol/chloroaromatic compound transport system permease large subunit